MPDQPKQDLQQVGASRSTHALLTELKETGQIADLVDGYRLCIATAYGYGCEPNLERIGGTRTTIFAANTLDTPDLALRTAIAESYPEARATPYRAAEDLAEQGAEILRNLMDGEKLRFSDLIGKIEELARVGKDAT